MEVQFQEFVYLRPVFIMIIIFLLALLALAISAGRNKLFNRFSFFCIVFICLSVSSVLLISSGYIVDAYGLGGDAAIFDMWLAIIGLSVLNTFVFLRKSSVNQ